MGKYEYKFDYNKVKSYRLYEFMKTTFRPLLKVLYKIEYKGLENLPKSGTRYIVAVNHTHAFDPLFVAAPKPVPPLHFMAKSELFSNPLVSWFLTHINAFPVRRGKGDNSAIEYGEKIIEEGHVMAICPEGTRITDKGGKPQKAKAGVAVIAKATNAGVLPVAIYCDGKIKPGRKVTVIYGKMITCDELGFNKEDFGARDIRSSATKIMEKIINLWEAEHNDKAC